MSKIRLAIAGVGNCASSLIQGLEFYKDADPHDDVPGLMHVELGGYHIRDIELVAAFDVDADKVGLDASKAIFSGRNNTVKFAEVPHLAVEVLRGPTFDGFGEFYRQVAEESPAEPVDVAQALRDANADRVRMLARITGWTHAQVNGELNRLSSVSKVSEATVEQLESRLAHADRWLTRL
jgi:myo-inositol-1-phosphate synthase